MTYYLYVPFKKKEVSERQKAIIKQWITIENTRSNHVNVCYLGEKTLQNLPKASKVYVLFHGKAGQASPLLTHEHVPTELARKFESFSTHLKVNDGKHSLLIPEVADKMVADGLLNGFAGHLNIKLFFYDENKKNALTLTDSFFNSLDAKTKSKNGNIKIDYYADIPPNAISDNGPSSFASKPKGQTTKTEEFIERAKLPQYSFYNTVDCAPKLSIQQMFSAIKQYNEYKSARCCGLSGLLHLNGLFSSDASAHAIKYLTTSSISEDKRFDYASKFLARFPNNYFAECLKPLVEKSLQDNELIWDGKKPAYSSGFSMGF